MLTLDQEKEWIDKGYDPTTLAHRKLLLDVIAKYEPFDSLLDVGCGHGSDLVLLEMVYPENRKFMGIDLKNQEIVFGLNKLKNTIIIEGDFTKLLSKVSDKMFDIVMMNGVLMYNELHWVKELIRIAKKAVILSERDRSNTHTEMMEYFEEIGLHPNVTKVTKDIRSTWGDDGYIYEIRVG